MTNDEIKRRLACHEQIRRDARTKLEKVLRQMREQDEATRENCPHEFVPYTGVRGSYMQCNICMLVRGVVK